MTELTAEIPKSLIASYKVEVGSNKFEIHRTPLVIHIPLKVKIKGKGDDLYCMSEQDFDKSKHELVFDEREIQGKWTLTANIHNGCGKYISTKGEVKTKHALRDTQTLLEGGFYFDSAEAAYSVIPTIKAEYI